MSLGEQGSRMCVFVCEYGFRPPACLRAMMPGLTGPQLSGLLWCLVQLCPPPPACLQAMMPGLTGPQLSGLLWCLVQLRARPGENWMDAVVAGEVGGVWGGCNAMQCSFFCMMGVFAGSCCH